MTVLNQTKKVSANGNGVATTFSFSPMVIYKATELEVTRVSDTGVETPVPLGTGTTSFSVLINLADFPATGSIQYPEDQVTPLPTGEKIFIRRVLVHEQAVDLQNEGGYFADTHEVDIEDKQAMRDLQLQEEIDRSIKFPVSDVATVDIPDISLRKNTVLGFNGIGDVIVTGNGASILDLSSHTLIADNSSTTRTLKSVAADVPFWGGTAGGTGDAATITTTAILTSYVAGQVFRYITGGASSVINPTVNVDTAGIKTIKNKEGYPLSVGAIPDSFILDLLYDGTNMRALNLREMRNHISGLELSNNSGDAVNDIDISIGEYRADNGAMLAYSSISTRAIDAVFTEGGPGFRDSGDNLTGAKWFHIYVIGDPTKTNDFFASTSVAPTLPSGFTVSRRIGSVNWTGSTITAFLQDNNRFYLDAPIEDINDVNPGTSAVLSALTVPLGINTIATFIVILVDSSFATFTNAIISSPDQTDTTPSVTIRTAVISVANNTPQIYQQIKTDTSSQIRYRLDQSTANHSVIIETLGWIDDRGQN